MNKRGSAPLALLIALLAVPIVFGLLYYWHGKAVSRQPSASVANPEANQVPSGDFLFAEPNVIPDDANSLALLAYNASGTFVTVAAQLPNAFQPDFHFIRLYGTKVYYIAENGSALASFDFTTGKTSYAIAPEASPSYPLQDFLVTPDGDLFYLIGSCVGDSGCDLKRADQSFGSEATLFRNLTVPVNGAIELLDYDPPSTTLVIAKYGGGDSSDPYTVYFSFDANKDKESVNIGSKTCFYDQRTQVLISCQTTMNIASTTFDQLAPQNPTTADCGGATISLSDAEFQGKTFLGCAD